MAETPTPQPRPAVLTWIHSDPRGLEPAMRDAFARAQGRAWRDDEASVADLRALLVYVLSTAGELGPNPPRTVQLASGAVWSIPVTAQPVRDDHAGMAAGLLMGLFPLLGVRGLHSSPKLGESVRVETQGGSLPSGPTPDRDFTGRDAAALPALAYVAMIAVGGAVSTAMALYFSQTNELKASEIVSSESVQKHAATLASLSSLVDAHVQRERSEGRTIPWEGPELELFDMLRKSTLALSEVQSPDLKTLPDVQAISESVAKATEDVGAGVRKAAESTGFGLGTAAVVAGVLWALAA